MLVRRFREPVYNRNRSFELFNELFNSMDSQEEKEVFDFSPSVNTREGKEAYNIDVDLPGINKEDVDISVDKNVLTISGKRETKNEVKEEDYYRIESNYGSFSRSFTLPEKVDVEIIIPKLMVLTDSTKKIEIE